MIMITIRTEGAAFQTTDAYSLREAEVARILRHLADNVEDGRALSPLLDSNGNPCGKVTLTGIDKPKRTRRI